MEEILARLAAANIQLLPLTHIENHFVFERDGFISLVERARDGGFGRIGAAGLLTERGMAMPIERSSRMLFVAKGLELEATGQQIAALRAFDSDLRAALAP
ncbi:MAG: hypothetical protein JNK48_18810 [Bryobacterales bacterium]|nr:hypothetical protein [Bryobacterales bacterium]